MPEVFTKDCKVNVIEYGENCDSFPLLDRIKTKIKDFFKRG